MHSILLLLKSFPQIQSQHHLFTCKIQPVRQPNASKNGAIITNHDINALSKE